MAQKVNKLIVTNVAVLLSKYGSTGLARIKKALDGLIASDSKRGLNSRLVALDDPAEMETFDGKAVVDPIDAKQNKKAIDAVYQFLTKSQGEPDYLMLLGAIDVIPHQDMLNPLVFRDPPPTIDVDTCAFGDLPYACERPYSQDVKNFLSPTRVVGRLPDVVGLNDPKYLIDLIDTAASFQARPFADYSNHLGISAAEWSNSTFLSLQEVFGSSAKLQLSPPEGPTWPGSLLSTRSHFINCHGATGDTRFFGQSGDSFPVAHDATLLNGILEGTVVSAECCYGAEMFDPTFQGGQSGICNEYLKRKAYGFFGSSTIAYGPSSGNGAADLICQSFLKYVLSGTSLGRATLQARQDYISGMNLVDPVDLKTLAQFSLLGDPSVHPVQSVSLDDTVIKLGTAKKTKVQPGDLANTTRAFRRESLKSLGLLLPKTIRSFLPDSVKTSSPSIRKILANVISAAGGSDTVCTTMQVEAPKNTAKLATAGPTINAIHIASGLIRSKTTNLPFDSFVLVIAREQDNNLALRTYFSR